MKVRSGLFGCNDSDRRRQQRVERPLELPGAQFGLSLEVCDLPGSMNARIRASRPLNLQPLLRELLQNIAQRALDCRLSGLDLPSAEIGSVVRQSEFDVMHEDCAQLSHAHGHSLPNAYLHLEFAD